MSDREYAKSNGEAERVPLMFQAQLPGRGKIQYAREAEKAYQWVGQWLEGCPPIPKTSKDNLPVWRRTQTQPAVKLPQFGSNVKTEEYTFNWRLVTNSGQDEGLIRPVIGAKGLPFYPGASMKGAFLRACPEELRLKYCGGKVLEDGQIKTKPGFLRFHGAYPVDMSWGKQELLVDVVYSQEKRQVMDNTVTSPHPQISLYQPTLRFGISSTQKLDDQEWQQIWKIWEQALATGIGSRVSAGYGQVAEIEDKQRVILSVHLCGQGLASQLLNNTGEFRPNMFKAALRGHTLRLFGGVTDKDTAQKLTKQLWGGFNDNGNDKGAVVGLLGIHFTTDEEELNIGQHKYRQGSPMPTYDLQSGRLNILCISKVSPKQKHSLKTIATQLIKFSLLLGGFGKSWRRVDHRRFFPDYFRYNDKPMIGCHWEFTEASEHLYITATNPNLSNITKFLENIQQTIIDWVKINKLEPNNYVTEWREVWHPQKVQVWGRIVQDEHSSEAIEWFHRPYSGNKSIKQTDLTGKIGGNNNPSKVGRIWHRMYPRYIKTKAGNLEYTGEYVELLTIFPDNSQTTQDFLTFLRSSTFTKLF